ncbi:hypothetical protein Cgig2_023855 [Carnegiea gigantea]|uniref:Uncharacterized protein n=1 Tax=Carnegiea gigantea TaxID=171969 RepID=A0A9Q1GMH5_9CARY|nr:hypothetical protein Cgig2_023855 [Carnegiea gigantea]
MPKSSKDGNNKWKEETNKNKLKMNRVFNDFDNSASSFSPLLCPSCREGSTSFFGSLSPSSAASTCIPTIIEPSPTVDFTPSDSGFFEFCGAVLLVSDGTDSSTESFTFTLLMILNQNYHQQYHHREKAKVVYLRVAWQLTRYVFELVGLIWLSLNDQNSEKVIIRSNKMPIEGSSSSSKCNRATEEEQVIMYPRCNSQATRKVSHSNQNLRRGYYKRVQCKKFVKWTDEINCHWDKKIFKSFNEVKVELTEIRMMLKLIEKGKI